MVVYCILLFYLLTCNPSIWLVIVLLHFSSQLFPSYCIFHLWLQLETEKSNRDKQIETLNGDIAKLDEDMEKLGKEKKAVEDNLQETIEQLQSAEDKGNKLAKEKAKVEGVLKDVRHFLRDLY